MLTGVSLLLSRTDRDLCVIPFLTVPFWLVLAVLYQLLYKQPPFSWLSLLKKGVALLYATILLYLGLNVVVLFLVLSPVLGVLLLLYTSTRCEQA